MKNWVLVDDDEWENEKAGATIRIWFVNRRYSVMYEEWATNGVSMLYKSINRALSIKYAKQFMKKHPIIKPRSIKEHPSVWR